MGTTILSPKYGNNNDAFIPEMWANESLAILEENMVLANIIHRDFSPTIAKFGDTVNTRKPSEFTARRKDMTDNVTIQDATATNIPVVLNQHVHTSFIIYDGEESKAFKDLVAEYLRPAMLANARLLDRVVAGQYHRFISNARTAGKLQSLTNSTAKRYILDTRNAQNLLKVPEDNGRNFAITPISETEILDTDIFLSAEKVGDGGTALREASIGRKLGYNFWMSQNVPYVDVAGTIDTAAGTITSATAAGNTASMACTVSGYDVAVGSWVTIAGDMQPYRVTARTFSTNTTAITVDRPLKFGCSGSAVLTAYKTCTVNLSGGYAAGYSKTIVLDGFTSGKFLQVGQILSTATVNYTVINVESASGTAQTVTLDRPLEASLANDEVLYPGPAGAYNLALHKNALGLVVRPLAAPKVSGLLASVVNYNDLSMRAVITYDGNKQGHLVTLDFLCGIAALDLDLGAIMFG